MKERIIKADNYFDLLRLIAASLVILSHSFTVYGVPEDPERLLLSAVFKAGGFGVEIFFVISGYLITASWFGSEGALHYARKRFLRIYPALWTAILLTLLAGGALSSLPLAEYAGQAATWRYALNALLPLEWANRLPGVFEDNPFPANVNASLWTLGLELPLYLFIGVLGALRLLQPRVMAPIVILLAAGYMLAQYQDWKPLEPLYGSRPGLRLMYFFCAGSLLWFYRARLPRHGAALLAMIAVLAMSFATPWFRPLKLLLLPLLVLGMAHWRRESRLQHVSKYGDFSYGMYIYAFPIQQILMQFFGASLSLEAFIFLAFSLSWMAAFASWHVIEKRALKYKMPT